MGEAREQEHGMSKQQLIERIQQVNRSADEGFLVHFNQEALEKYLQRLDLTRGRRGRPSVWVRTGESPAVATREH